MVAALSGQPLYIQYAESVVTGILPLWNGMRPRCRVTGQFGPHTFELTQTKGSVTSGAVGNVQGVGGTTDIAAGISGAVSIFLRELVAVLTSELGSEVGLAL